MKGSFRGVPAIAGDATRSLLDQLLGRFDAVPEGLLRRSKRSTFEACCSIAKFGSPGFLGFFATSASSIKIQSFQPRSGSRTLSLPAAAVYKCQANGKVTFQETHCRHGRKPAFWAQVDARRGAASDAEGDHDDEVEF
jgi:hypothetical protein